MFRMKFQSTVEPTSSEEVDERTVRDVSSVSCSPESTPKVVLFEGNVGKFGMIRPLPSSDKTWPHLADGHPSLRNTILSPSTVLVAPSPKPKRADIDLVKLEAQTAQESAYSSPQQATTFDGLDGTPVTGNDSLTDKTTFVAHLHFQTSIRGQDSKMIFVEAPCALVGARLDSSRISESSECSTPTHRDEEEDEAMTEMMNKLMQDRKKLLCSDSKFAKPWEEPLLSAHDQEELDLVAKEKAKIEAKRLAEEERLERERHLCELRDLAHCNLTASAPSLRRSPNFKKSKLKKILGSTRVTGVYRFLKSPFRIFRSHKKYAEYPDARGAKLIIPKANLFGRFPTVPSSGTTDSQLAMMRNAPQPRITRRPNIQFKTVESTQRDVPAWTSEEYLRKNGRIPQSSTNKQEDEDFGGIEGNNLMNQYFNDGILTDYDSDSD